MGAELGATTSVFPFDEPMDRYLRGTDRAALADLAERNAALLAADPEVERDPARFFARVVEIDLSTLEPHLVGPHTPDLARPVSEVAAAVAKEGYPDAISVALIGSCTNSSYEDISRVADVVAAGRGATGSSARSCRSWSRRARSRSARRSSATARCGSLEAVGATVLANACGPCIGQWKRDEIKPGEKNTIVTSFNRNFPRAQRRQRGDAGVHREPGDRGRLRARRPPELQPARPTRSRSPGKAAFRLDPPAPAPDLPPGGFVQGRRGLRRPARRRQLDRPVHRAREPAPAAARRRSRRGTARTSTDCPLLLKATGKCTTDHISPAGPWLRFRGHLDNISDNMFTGAVNAFTGEAGTTLDQLAGERGGPVPKVARAYKARGLRWVVVGDENYGEGSSREHAAMSPRLLGAAAILVRSFARIHETNLKKQGVLPLTFADPADYDRVRETDRISILGLADLAPGRRVTVVLHHADGTRRAHRGPPHAERRADRLVPRRLGAERPAGSGLRVRSKGQVSRLGLDARRQLRPHDVARVVDQRDVGR